jgi:hypothetical protein
MTTPPANRQPSTRIDEPAGQSTARHVNRRPSGRIGLTTHPPIDHSAVNRQCGGRIDLTTGESTIRQPNRPYDGANRPPSGPTNNTVGQSTANQGYSGPIDETACQSTKRRAQQHNDKTSKETQQPGDEPNDQVKSPTKRRRVQRDAGPDEQQDGVPTRGRVQRHTEGLDEKKGRTIQWSRAGRLRSFFISCT